MPDKRAKPARKVPWELVYARELLARFRTTPPELVKNVSPFPDRLWDRLKHNGVRVKDQVVGHLPCDSRLAKRARAWQWEIYKATRPNWVPWVVYALERQWTGLFERTRPRRPIGSPFDDLPPSKRAEAQNLFNRFCERAGSVSPAALSDWRKPLLAGVARRLASDPFNRSPEWGRKMRRIKGGKHVQLRYREQGWHPLASVRKAWGLSADRRQHDSTTPPPDSASQPKL